MTGFSDPQAVARYAEGPPRLVPGFAGMQTMAMLLIAERVPSHARLLVLGAGGGLEIQHFAGAQPGWHFDGVDPSAEMLGLADHRLKPIADRIKLHHGLIDIAPDGPFDAATCLLTLHFIEPVERLRTLREIHRRLKPGAPLVVAHFSFPQEAEARKIWLSRYAAFAIASGMDSAIAETAHTRVGAQLPILSPEADESLLKEAGFDGISLFYAGFTFRGWVCYA